MTIPPKKYELVAASEQMVVDIENQYKMGFMTDHERYKQVVQVWEKTTDEVSDRPAGRTWTATTPSS